jgi:hypothetical protein
VDLSRRLRLKCHPKMAAWDRLIEHARVNSLHRHGKWLSFDKFPLVSCIRHCKHWTILYLSHFSWHVIYTSLGNGRVSRVEGHRSRVEGHKSRVIGRGSKVEVEGQKSRSRVKNRGRGSKVEVEGQKSRSRVKSRGSKVENTKFLSILKVNH